MAETDTIWGFFLYLLRLRSRKVYADVTIRLKAGEPHGLVHVVETHQVDALPAATAEEQAQVSQVLLTQLHCEPSPTQSGGHPHGNK